MSPKAILLSKLYFLFMQDLFSIKFANGLTAKALYPQANADLTLTLEQLGLSSPRPVIVVVGGASKLSEVDRERLRSLFLTVLAPLAESLNAYVVDGGTDAGIMQMMGEARYQTGGTFPLIGVTAVGLATLPNQPPPAEDACALEPHHTHFVLVPGSQWGDESAWIAAIASTLSGFCPSVTVLINGGEITWKDAQESVKAKHPIVAISGSGRTADILVAALNGTVEDDRAPALVDSGLLQAVDLDNPKALDRVLKQIVATCSEASSLNL
jgi:SLOG in TRPM, prokaryote